LELNITKDKLASVFQKMIDMELSFMKNLDYENAYEDFSDGTLEDIHTVESIKIVSIDVSDFTTTNVQYYKCTVDVVYDAVGGISLDSILLDLSYHIKKYTGLVVILNDGYVHNKYLDYGQI